MWEIINEIARRGTMDSNEISDYSINTLQRVKRSAGGCMHQAVSRRHVEIIGTIYKNGREINTYRVR